MVVWVFVSVQGLSLAAASGGHSSSRCAGLSLSWPLLLRSTGSRRAGSVVVAHGPQLRSMWDLPRPGLEPVSPALAGRFSTTAPPGKPSFSFFNIYLFYFWLHGVLVAACRLSCPAACGILVPRPGIRTCVPCIGRWILNHWTTREVPTNISFKKDGILKIIIQLNIS